MAITSEKLQPAEFHRLRYAMTLPAGETLEDAMKPDYWKHCATKLKPGTIIEIVPEDGSFYAELFVKSSEATWARTALIAVTVFDEKAVKQAQAAQKAPTGQTKIPNEDKGEEHYVDWGGAQAKGRVIRLADKQVVKEGFASKAEAKVWMVSHEAENAKAAAEAEKANQALLGGGQ